MGPEAGGQFADGCEKEVNPDANVGPPLLNADENCIQQCTSVKQSLKMIIAWLPHLASHRPQDGIRLGSS